MRRRLQAMVRDGQLVKIKGNRYALMKNGDVLRGRIVGHKEGFGFFEPEDGTTRIFISAREMRKVIDGDIVFSAHY